MSDETRAYVDDALRAQVASAKGAINSDIARAATEIRAEFDHELRKVREDADEVLRRLSSELRDEPPSVVRTALTTSLLDRIGELREYVNDADGRLTGPQAHHFAKEVLSILGTLAFTEHDERAMVAGMGAELGAARREIARLQSRTHTPQPRRRRWFRKTEPTPTPEPEPVEEAPTKRSCVS